MRLPFFLRRSVSNRTTMLVVGIVTVIMLVSGFFEMQIARREVAEEMHAQASRSMDGAIKELDTRVANVEAAVNTAASYADMFAPHEVKATTLLDRLIAANEDIDAVTLLYQADFFPKHGRYYAPTVYRDENETFVHDEIGGPENDFCYLETDSNWVYTNKLDEGYWCLPYVDSMSTNRPMVTYSVPLHDNEGKIYAVLCADVGLEWVQEVMEEHKPYPYSRISVMSRDAKYICHPDSANILSVNALELAARQNDTGLLFLTERMLRGDSGSDTVDNSYVTSETKKEELEDIIVYFAPVRKLKWSVSFTLPESKIMERPNRLRRNMIFFLIIVIIVLSYVLNRVIKKQLRPMTALAESTRQVATGNFHVKLPDIRTQDEFRQFRDSFENMQVSLEKYVEELKASTALKVSIENEMKVASNIQMGMLPKAKPPFPDRTDIDIFAKLKPAKEVGGDLYDFHIRDNRLYFCIGDVSGKGVPAALFMAMTRSLFRNITATSTTPEETVMALNRSLSDGNDYNMFCTMFLGILDLNSGELNYCNAGHNAPVFITGNDVHFMETKVNVPLGIIDGFPFEVGSLTMKPDDALFLYTDGVTEAEDTRQRQFGEDAMMSVLENVTRQESHLPADYVKTMFQAVRKHAVDAVQSDDITIMHLLYKS